MVTFDKQFILDKLSSLGVAYKASGSNYLMPCPICHEGGSSGKRERCYYLNGKCFHCHNCQRSYSVYDFLHEVTGETFIELKREWEEWSGGEELDRREYISFDFEEETVKKSLALPEGCVNLSDTTQKKFYNNAPDVQKAIKYCDERLLFSAINAVDLYYCRSDYVHKGRLIIPFYHNREIVYYQSRYLPGCSVDIKYLCKSEKKTTLFNQDKIEANIPYLFIFEGPIDSMFVRNGVAIAGLKPTQEQMQIIDQYRMTKEIIWVLDNEPTKKEVREQYQDLAKKGEKTFLWTEIEHKDMNDFCVHHGLNQFDFRQIIQNSGNPDLFLIS